MGNLPEDKDVEGVKTKLATGIENLIMQGEYREAVISLRQLAIDYAPMTRYDTSHLLSRINRYDREARLGLSHTDNINDITGAALELLQEVVQSQAAPSWPFELGTNPVNAASRDTTRESNGGLQDISAVVDSDNLRHSVIQHGLGSMGQGIPCVVSMKEVERSYGSGGFLLGPISIALRPGRIAAVMGKNGSGKSTLLKIIAGRLMQTNGEIDYPYLSTSRNWATIKTQIAYMVPGRFNSSYSIRETLEYLAASNGKTGRSNKEIVDDYLSRYDLERYSTYSWAELSDGYFARFHLLRALIAAPKLLVLDEPLANLDVGARTNFLYELRELSRSFSNPMCIVVSTHHTDEAELIADDLLVLREGKCLFFGDKQKLRQMTPGPFLVSEER